MRFLIIAGFIIFIGSIFLLIGKFDDLKVEKNGIIVDMKIEKLPKSCIGARVRYFVTYNFNGKLFEKATRGDFCKRHHEGEVVSMKYLEGSDIILKPSESVVSEMWAFGFLSLLGISISIFQIRRKRLLN